MSFKLKGIFQESCLFSEGTNLDANVADLYILMPLIIGLSPCPTGRRNGCLMLAERCCGDASLTF